MLKFRRLKRLSKVLPYLRPHWGKIVVAGLVSIPLAALNFSPALAMKYLSDEVLVQHRPDALWLLVLAIPAAAVANLVLRFSSNYLMRSAANQMIETLRNDLYRQITRLSLGYFNEVQGGVLLSRVINDVQVIVRAVSSVIDAVKEPLSLLAMVLYAFYMSWKITAVTMIVVPVIAILLSNAARHSKRYSSSILNSLGEMSALLGESISGMRVVQSFNLEPYLREQFRKLNRHFTDTALKAIRVEELSRPSVDLVYSLALSFLLYFVGRDFLRGHLTAGDVISYFTNFGMMLNPLRKISELNVTISQSSAAVDSVFAILEQDPEILEKPNAVALGPFADSIEFDNLTFRYGGEKKGVLRRFSLRVKKGEVVALVGPSGAGKSTVLSLIPRFFDAQEGAVRIDGKDLRDLTLYSIREQVALVTQEVFLFHDTVRANIKAGRPDLTDAQVKAAAEAAQAWGFIERLPQGLDTVIGDRGQKLSGGERQRLSIARALLKDAPILLLDEATSALHSENERLVQAALDRLMVGRTALVVAHRLSTIRRADRILVLEQGGVVEEGSHDALLAKGGAYARALSLQETFQR
ncbi:MAG: ABC transporter ATP-binding protein [Bdellovibrionota bacterium]